MDVRTNSFYDYSQGSQDQPGLVTMAMEEILEFSKTISGAVWVSSYQVVHDTHIFDLLEPKDQEVLILEDQRGRTHLKGLSKVQISLLLLYSVRKCKQSIPD
jgi:kinesin family protein 22